MVDNRGRKYDQKMKPYPVYEYAKEHFGMFGGEKEHITLRFIEPLLDTVI